MVVVGGGLVNVDRVVCGHEVVGLAENGAEGGEGPGVTQSLREEVVEDHQAVESVSGRQGFRGRQWRGGKSGFQLGKSGSPVVMVVCSLGRRQGRGVGAVEGPGLQ